ncbi:MAG: DUF1080 domain-containing protein [Balneolales bacterium]
MVFLICSSSESFSQSDADPAETEVWEPVPVMVRPGNEVTALPPSDAIVLFDGSGLGRWTSMDGSEAEWTVKNGYFTVAEGTGDIKTRQNFTDFQLFLEWRSPTEITGEGQGRGNSGVFLQGRYELQVLDSYNNPTYSNGQAGSIYKQHIPLVNATRPPGEWNSYNVVYTAPRFDANGEIDEPARVTVLHNGILIQDNVEIQGNTVYRGQPFYEQHGPGPIVLQDHGDLVSYRNIWIREK